MFEFPSVNESPRVSVTEDGVERPAATDGFISTARSFHVSAVPRVQEKLVTVLVASGPLLLDAPEVPDADMSHCVVVEAPFVNPPLWPDPTASITHAPAFAFVMLTVAGELSPPALSLRAVVGMGVVWSTPVNETTPNAAPLFAPPAPELMTTLAVPLGGFIRYHIDSVGNCVSATACVSAVPE